MKINEIKLCGKNSLEIETEIKFHIAAARALNTDLFNIYFDSNESKNISGHMSSALKILRAEKKAGKILLFIAANELSNQSTEAAYLINKYPYISTADIKENSFIIKI